MGLFWNIFSFERIFRIFRALCIADTDMLPILGFLKMHDYYDFYGKSAGVYLFFQIWSHRSQYFAPIFPMYLLVLCMHVQ